MNIKEVDIDLSDVKCVEIPGHLSVKCPNCGTITAMDLNDISEYIVTTKPQLHEIECTNCYDTIEVNYVVEQVTAVVTLLHEPVDVSFNLG